MLRVYGNNIIMKRKIILYNYQSPGDILMLTAAVRDLKRAHWDKFVIGVDTSCGEIWENNPYINPDLTKDVKDAEVIHCEYPLIHQSNQTPYHFIHGFRKFLEEKLEVDIPVKKHNNSNQNVFCGDIHLSKDELNDKDWARRVHGLEDGFWIMLAGGKYDFTAKWWDPACYQAVVDHFQGKIQFAQCGEPSHWHPPLDNVVNLIGKTNLREFIRLIYHSSGVVCPITFAMHAAAAIPMKTIPPQNRPCVVIAGGREPAQWEQYPHHRFLSTNGALDCCDNGGCWKSRCQKVGDGDEKDVKDLCIYPVQLNNKLSIPKCMQMISHHDVINAIDMYYKGGVLKYKNTPKIVHEKRVEMPELKLFRPRCFEEAQEMVVGTCNGVSTEDRWKLETPLFAEAISRHIRETGADIVVDYGVGCGRMAKTILDMNPQLKMLYGVDSSREFIQASTEYCNNIRFKGILPKETTNIQAKVVYSTYVLQHIPAIELRDAIYRIYEILEEVDCARFINCCSTYRMAMNFETNSFFDDRCLGVDIPGELNRVFDRQYELFTDDEFEQHEVLRKLVKGEGGGLEHPAWVYKKKNIS